MVHFPLTGSGNPFPGSLDVADAFPCAAMSGTGITHPLFFHWRAHMFWSFTSAVIIGLILHTFGKYSVMVNIFTVTFKVAALALVVAALIFLYRKFAARNRSDRPRRLLP